MEGRSSTPSPNPSYFMCTKKLDALRIETTFNSLLDSANQLSQLRLLAVSRPESGDWLNALPLSSMVLWMVDDVIRIAVALRLGLPLCWPYECSNCGAQIEVIGRHGFSCLFSRGRQSRHASLNDIIKLSLDEKENPGVGCYLCVHSGTLTPGTRGKRCWGCGG